MINPTIMVALITGTFSLTQIVVTYLLNNKNAKKEDLVDIMKKDEYERYKTYLVDYLAEVENGMQKSEIQKQRASEIYDKYTKIGRKFVCSRKMGGIAFEKLLIKQQINILQRKWLLSVFTRYMINYTNKKQKWQKTKRHKSNIKKGGIKNENND